ncbi:MAG: SPOR domain-containing protein, partial [Proteobacteria bacterium]|nr:SPOR domain-containing protein [Pseudomonadota bacterium]
GAEENDIFVDAGPEDPAVAAPALDLALNVAEELPPAEATEPAAEENISIVGAQPAVLEEAVPAIEEAVAAIEEAVPAIEIATSAAEELPIAASPATPAEIITLSEITGNFYIIIASFLTEIKAREHAVSLSTSQETPIIISPFGASRRYRVAIAGFETMAEAQASLPAYKRTYGDDSWPLRYIVAGTTTLLRTGTDKFHVIVASFATEALARKHTEPLAASGENPSIIPPFGQSQQYRVALFAYDTLEAAQAALPQHRLIYASDAWLLRY